MRLSELERTGPDVPRKPKHLEVDDASLGRECAGIVRRVGPGVEGLQPRDRVLALCAGGMVVGAPARVVVDARVVASIPLSLDWATAATMPVAFLTALVALRDLAEVQPGETVLVHAAAGGVATVL